MARNAPARASLVRVRANARAVKNVEKPVRLRAVRATRNGVARDHAMLVHAMVNVMKPVRLPMARAMATGATSARLRADRASPVRHMARGIMVPGTEIVATLVRRHAARAMVARVTSARLAMVTAERMVRRIESHAVWNGAISDRLRMVRAMATGAISAPRIVVRETMIATASARRMASGRAMAVRGEVVRAKTACDGLRKVARGISVRQGGGRGSRSRGKWGLGMMPGAAPVRRLAVPVTADVAKSARHLAVRAKTDRAALRKQIVIEMPAGDHR